MKKTLFLALIACFMLTAFQASAQTKKARTSPADTVRGTISKNVKVEIAYSQPSIKGRTIGKEIAPYNGQPWRTGANEPTAITVSAPVKVEGKELPAGKYSIWTIPAEGEWTVIFNKNTTSWGTKYDETQDVFRVKVKPKKAPAFAEALKFSIDPAGKVILTWGDVMLPIAVK